MAFTPFTSNALVPHIACGTPGSPARVLAKRAWDSGSNTTVKLYVAFLLITTSFFFLDPTVYLPKAVITLASWVVLAVLVARGRLNVVLSPLLLLAYPSYIMMLRWIHFRKYSTGDLLIPTGVTTTICFILLLSESSDVMERIANRYIQIMTILNFMAIPIFFGVVLNLGLPYSPIRLADRDVVCRNYFNLAVITEDTIIQTDHFTFARLNGLFEEPGMLGTIMAFLLMADLALGPGHRMRKAILLILGLLSCSLTFYLSLLFILMGTMLRSSGGSRWGFWAIILLIGAAISAFLTLPDAEYGVNKLIGARLAAMYAGDGSSGSSSTWDTGGKAFGQEFDDYMRSATTSELVFGNGPTPANNDGMYPEWSTYRATVYEYGILGCALGVLFPLYWLIVRPLQARQFAMTLMLIPAFLSLYHRPELFSPYYGVLYAAIAVVLLRKQQTVQHRARVQRSTIEANATPTPAR